MLIWPIFYVIKHYKFHKWNKVVSNILVEKNMWEAQT